MNKSRFLIAPVIIILVSFFGCSTLPEEDGSTLLASSAVTRSGGSHTIATGVVFTLSEGIMPGGPGVFNSLVLTPDDTGSSYTIVSSDDEDFTTVTDTLTNGIDDYLSFQYTPYPGGGGSGGGTTESGLFLGGVTGECLPDFAGFQIDYFKLTINSLTLDVPGSDPNEDGIWTDYSIDLQIEVYGRSL
jgi:hypothetical protein